MKMYGSIYNDNLFGTSGRDLIYGGDGNDLISGWHLDQRGAADKIYAGTGTDLISGLSIQFDNPARSQSRGALVDGGSGYDTLIVDSSSRARSTELSRIHAVAKIDSIEEIIYNLSGLTSKQTAIGTNAGETIYIGEAGSKARGGKGDDYLFSGLGDDSLDGGDGNDFLSAGHGHNELSGGKGADYFQFRLESGWDNYEYSNIADFQSGTDKIAIVLGEGELSGHDYGHDYWSHPRAIDPMGYLHYDDGRRIDRDDFSSDADLFRDNIIYQQSTGSILLINEDGEQVLFAHLDMANKPELTSSDFVFYVPEDLV